MTETRKTGAELITAERQRHITEEGWTPEHDRDHINGELAEAAACYAMTDYHRGCGGVVPEWWPWADEFWKPCLDDRVRELVKAGALIAAEIDRLQSEASGATGTSGVS